MSTCRFGSAATTSIGALFAARAYGVGMMAWVMLGGFAGYFWSRETVPATRTQTA